MSKLQDWGITRSEAELRRHRQEDIAYKAKVSQIPPVRRFFLTWLARAALLVFYVMLLSAIAAILTKL